MGKSPPPTAFVLMNDFVLVPFPPPHPPHLPSHPTSQATSPTGPPPFLHLPPPNMTTDTVCLADADHRSPARRRESLDPRFHNPSPSPPPPSRNNVVPPPVSTVAAAPAMKKGVPQQARRQAQRSHSHGGVVRCRTQPQQPQPQPQPLPLQLRPFGVPQLRSLPKPGSGGGGAPTRDSHCTPSTQRSKQTLLSQRGAPAVTAFSKASLRPGGGANAAATYNRRKSSAALRAIEAGDVYSMPASGQNSPTSASPTKWKMGTRRDPAAAACESTEHDPAAACLYKGSASARAYQSASGTGFSSKAKRRVPGKQTAAAPLTARTAGVRRAGAPVQAVPSPDVNGANWRSKSAPSPARSSGCAESARDLPVYAYASITASDSSYPPLLDPAPIYSQHRKPSYQVKESPCPSRLPQRSFSLVEVDNAGIAVKKERKSSSASSPVVWKNIVEFVLPHRTTTLHPQTKSVKLAKQKAPKRASTSSLDDAVRTSQPQSQPQELRMHAVDAADTANEARECVARFLAELNIASYLTVLLEEGYDDMRSLVTLTEADLLKFGMLKGHRARLLNAISQLSFSDPPSYSVSLSPSTSHVFSSNTGGGPADPVSECNASYVSRESSPSPLLIRRAGDGPQ